MKKLNLFFKLLLLGIFGLTLINFNICVYSKISLEEKERIVNIKLKKSISEYRKNSKKIFEIFNLEKANIIKNTDLYNIVRAMPKGANLHLHSCASFNSIFDFCYKNSNIYVDKDCYLYVSNKTKEVPIKFIPFKKAIDNHILSKEKIAQAWTIDKNTLRSNVWTKFQEIFEKIDALGSSESIFKDFYKLIFLECIKDNVYHLEIRFHLVNFENKEKSLILLREVYYEIKKDYPNFTLKVILAKSKNEKTLVNFKNFILEANGLKNNIKDEFDKHHISNFIIGFDLVGEDKKDSLKPYVNKFLDLKKVNGVNISPYLHAGESDDILNDGLIYAYKMGTKRVGHGTNLYAFPKLTNLFKKKGICLEVCPISNQVLKLVNDISEHPARKYFKDDVPIAICSDDQCMFGTEGLSYDFFEVIVAWNLDLFEIKKLIINSIKYSALSDYEKNKALLNWTIGWERFINNQFEI